MKCIAYPVCHPWMMKHLNAKFVNVFILEIFLMFAWTFIISWKNIFQQNMNLEGKKFSLRSASAIMNHHLLVSLGCLVQLTSFLFVTSLYDLLERGEKLCELLDDQILPRVVAYIRVQTMNL
jgi:hypothetical protein